MKTLPELSAIFMGVPQLAIKSTVANSMGSISSRSFVAWESYSHTSIYH